MRRSFLFRKDEGGSKYPGPKRGASLLCVGVIFLEKTKTDLMHPDSKRGTLILCIGFGTRLQIKFLKKFISLNLVRNNHCPVQGSKRRTLDVFD